MEIKVSALTYAYERGTPLERKALQDINFHLKEGAFVCLTGQTGSGKSTLAQMLNGLLLPDEGLISYANGIVIDRRPKFTRGGKKKIKRRHKLKRWKELRRAVGLVFQFPEAQLFKNTVLADAMVGPLNFGFPPAQAKQAAQAALEQTGIPAEYWQKSPFELSGGEKRRVAIAGILAFKPAVLVLDEPTVGLDGAGFDAIMTMVQRLNAQGTTVVIITHDMALVSQYCQEMFVLNEGKIIGHGRPTTLFAAAELLQKASLMPPPCFVYGQYLKNHGVPLDLTQATDALSLAREIKRHL